MAADDSDDRYFIYENRLASFHGPQPVHKQRRTSTAGGGSSRAPKTLTWPHKSLSGADLARAGFYFSPRPSNPDNVACFLCRKELDGWEDDDEPLAEHLKHSPDCGWAVCAAVEAELGGAAAEDPRLPHLLGARRETFAGRWPYEGKKGWKCKTKQLAEAGWKYTPTLESDDHTTCTYCQLALDGWEPGDKPMDEHQRRSPDCPFFVLISQGPAPKKTARAKAARASKASRMSIQSVATATSDAPSVSDLAADHEDSIMTTTSVMTQGGSSKKATKGRKAAGGAAKSRKTRAKKEDAVEVQQQDAAEEDMPQLPPPPPPPPAKQMRGRKRASDAVEDSVLTNAEAPAPKKRATRTRGSTAVDTSVLAPEPDAEMAEPAPPVKPATTRKKGRASTAKRTRKESTASATSTASTASLRAQIPDDDEIERQLQADLDRPLTDDEDLAADSDSERKKKNAARPTKGKGKRLVSKKHLALPSSEPEEPDNEDFAMFDPAPAVPDEEAVDEELKALEAEMQVDEEEAAPQEIKVPKKGRKAATTRKVSKQTKKASEPAQREPSPEPQSVEEPEHVELEKEQEPEQPQEPEAPTQPEPVADVDVSMASTDTVVKGAAPGARLSNGKRGRGRPPKKTRVSEVIDEDQQPAQQAPNPAQRESLGRVVVEITPLKGRHSFSPLPQKKPVQEAVRLPAPAATNAQANVQEEKAQPEPPAVESESHARAPAPAAAPTTPGKKQITPSHSAKQATISPSQSPQSSDAENQPPSSKPAASAKRPMLAARTPDHQTGSSPSKQQRPANVIGGLQSATPWTAVDLETVFEGVGDEDQGVGGLAAAAKELASPETRMTVEEWIYHNAGEAERRLRHECEAMVGAFEREGTRAMGVLEGIVVD